MSENLHNIDDLFKRAINEHEDIPSQKVWDAIDKNLDKKKVVSISRKYNKLKWAAAILLLFSTGMAMYVWQTRMKNKELVKQNNINKATKSSKETINNNDKNATLPVTKTQPATNNQLQDDTQAENSATEKDKPTSPSLQKNTVPVTRMQKQDMAVTQTKDPVKEHQKDNTEKVLQSSGPIHADNNIVKEEDHTEPVVSTAKMNEKVPMITASQRWYGLQQVPTSNPFTYNSGMVNAPVTTAKNDNNNNTAAKIRRVRSASNAGLSATIFFSPEFVASDVKDDHPRFREDDRHEIKNNERVRAATNYGVLINYNPGKQFTLQSGISLFSSVTDINTKTIYARPDNNGNVNFRLSCSAGSAYVPLKSGATPAQGDSTRILSAKNTLQYVSVPLAIQYKLGKGKLSLITGVGIAANFLSKGKVETVIATSGGNESSISNIEGLKSNYLNGQVSLGAQYDLNKKIALTVTPTARMALSSINKDAAVKTKLNSFGLKAGITIKL